jgi:hypothetical protein
MKQRLAILAILSLCCVLGTASASVIGTLNVANCTGGGVTVSLSTIDWTLPVDSGFGCLAADTGTAITFGPGGSSTFTGGLGTINDLPIGGGAPFMTFNTTTGGVLPNGTGGTGPALVFDLDVFGPGSTTDCKSLAAQTLFTPCSVDAPNTPIILEKTGANASSLFVDASGTITDPLTGQITAWSGLYTTQFADLNPSQIEDFLNGVSTGTSVHCTNGSPAAAGNGSCSSTYSGSFAITISSVPEPSSMFLIGTGLLALATTLRKLKR